MSLKTIVRALGGDLYANGRRANIPAPGHSRHDRSVSLLEQNGRLIIHTFGGGDWRTVRDDLRARRLLGDERPSQGQAIESDPSDNLSRRRRRECALALWETGRDIEGTLSATHCRLRGIGGTLPDGEALRHHGLAPLSVYRSGPATRPALLAGIRAADGEIAGVEITYLGPGGRRAVGLRLPRKTVGLIPPSSAVRLAPIGEAVLVAEGVFTALSAGRRFGLPPWALLSTSNLRRWRPPAGVTSVLVAGDRGADGEASAAALVRALIEGGIDASLALPPVPFGDWNEVDQFAAGQASGT